MVPYLVPWGLAEWEPHIPTVSSVFLTHLPPPLYPPRSICVTLPAFGCRLTSAPNLRTSLKGRWLDKKICLSPSWAVWPLIKNSIDFSLLHGQARVCPPDGPRWQLKYETKGIYSALNAKLWLIKKWFIIATTSVSALGWVFFFSFSFLMCLSPAFGRCSSLPHHCILLPWFQHKIKIKIPAHSGPKHIGGRFLEVRPMMYPWCQLGRLPSCLQRANHRTFLGLCSSDTCPLSFPVSHGVWHD